MTVGLAACAHDDPASQEAWAGFVASPSTIFGSTESDNPFLVDVSRLPVATSSRRQIANLRRQIGETGGSAVINTREYNASFFIAGSQTPPVRVGFDNCQDKPGVPGGLYDGARHFVDVPIPTGAQPADGTDASLTVWSPATDQLWEFWVAQRQPDGQWTACWGGRIDNVSTSRGAFPPSFGASASGLVTVATAITVDEARRSRIEHALSLAMPRIAVDSRTQSPATRSDGTDASPDAIPMGARLRLDPDLDVESLPITPFGKAVARAAQRYGFIVTETSRTVAVGVESGKREQSATGTSPWRSVLGDTPDYLQLKGFPWEAVEVLDSGRTAGG